MCPRGIPEWFPVSVLSGCDYEKGLKSTANTECRHRRGSVREPKFKARMERGEAGLAGAYCGHSEPVLLRQVQGLAEHLSSCSGQVQRSHGVDLWNSPGILHLGGRSMECEATWATLGDHITKRKKSKEKRDQRDPRHGSVDEGACCQACCPSLVERED